MSQVFPGAYFLWIRRDLADSAYSDLKARRKRGGPEVWNSATTKNYREIQKLPYWEQVVEQQYFYSKRISQDLSQLSPERYCQIWYEDLCTNPSGTVSHLQNFLIPKGFRMNDNGCPIEIERVTNSAQIEKTADKDKISKYCKEQRFSHLRYCRN